MTPTEPFMESSTILKKVTEGKTNLPLQLTTWQKEYKEKLGLSSDHTTPTANDDTSSSDTVLPLHPKPLGLEIDHYQDRLNEIKSQYILLASKHQFLVAVLQDPPRQAHPDQVRELDTAVLKQYGELTILLRDISRLKNAIAEGNANNEKARQAMNKSSDTIIQMIDDIDAQKRALASLTSTNDYYASKRTPEQAQQLLEEQTRTMAEIQHNIDSKKESQAEMEFLKEDRLHEIKMLEETYRQVHIKAQEAVAKSGQRDVRVDKQAAWYTEMTELWHTMFGIEKVSVDIDLVQVTYATGDILSMYLDPLTELITGLEVNNDSVDLTDLEIMVKGHRIKDIGSTVVLETLARTRDS